MARNFKYLVLTNPVKGREDEYNQWYDNVHLGDVLRVDGFVAAQRFKADPKVAADAPFQYMAVYDIEADDPQAVLEGLNARAGTPDMVLSDALDQSNVLAVVYEEHAPRKLA
jgi:hypothetical protein